MGLYVFTDFRGFDGDSFYGHEHFLRDTSSRRLVYSNGSMFPICALIRAQKYIARGYVLPTSTIVEIAMAINALELKTKADLKAQLRGLYYDELGVADSVDSLPARSIL